MPNETRYIIRAKVLIDKEFSRVEFKIESVNWQKLVDYEEPELIVRNPGFKPTDNGGQVIGTVENMSNYDFNQIDIYAVLFDKDSKILGARSNR